MKGLYDLKIFRAQFQMGQRDLAKFLGLSRGMISMIELGKRALPVSCHLKLLECYQFKFLQPLKQTISGEAEKMVPEPCVKDDPYWQQRLTAIEYKMICGDNSISYKKKLLTKCCGVQQGLTNVIENFKGDEQELQLLMKRFHHVKAKMKNIDEIEILKQQIKISLLSAEATMIRQFLSGDPESPINL